LLYFPTVILAYLFAVGRQGILPAEIPIHVLFVALSSLPPVATRWFLSSSRQAIEHKVILRHDSPLPRDMYRTLLRLPFVVTLRGIVQEVQLLDLILIALFFNHDEQLFEVLNRLRGVSWFWLRRHGILWRLKRAAIHSHPVGFGQAARFSFTQCKRQLRHPPSHGQIRTHRWP
jgi:hypothetical protein